MSTARTRPAPLVLPLLLSLLAAAAPSVGRQLPFGASHEIAIATGATWLRVADLDRDGDLDLIGTSDNQPGNRDVVWYERDPGVAGGYLAHVAYSYSGEVYIEHFELADLDRDGDLDALVYRLTDWVQNTALLDWLENDGTPDVGSWTRRNIKTWEDQANVLLHRATGMAAADFDHDGDVDVAVGRFMEEGYTPDRGQIEWLGNDGTPADGGWNGHVLADWRDDWAMYSLHAADLDGDGDLDAVGFRVKYQDITDREVVWWENDGTPADGSWARHDIDLALTSAYQCVDDLDVGDIDGDGDLDVALGIPENLFWWSNDGTPADGVWSRHQIPAASTGSCSIQLADLDLDGDLDLASDENGVGWYENDGTPLGTWPFRLVENIPCDEVRVADLDGDGDPDLAGSDYDRFYWHENLQLHRSARLGDETGIPASIDGAYDLASGDLDGDGDTDLLSAAEAADQVYWHENRLPTGGSWLTRTISAEVDGPRAVATGDLDGDGDLDVVSASYNDATVAWFENDGTPAAGWVPRAISFGAGGAHDVTLADLDRDGDLDVACAQYLDEEISWYRNDGGIPPTFTAFFVDSAAPAGPRALATSDVDRDGDPDLVVVAGDADEMVWYENDGTPATGEWTVFVLDANEIDDPRDVVAVDLDRDGDDDLAVASYVGDEVRWFENDGSLGGWEGRSITTSCSGARGLATGDFDADGDWDLLATCYDEDRIRLLSSDGGPTPGFSSSIFTQIANGARSVLGADLDRDGDLDAAAAQGGDDEIAWYENRGGQFRVQVTTIAANPLANETVQGVLRLVVTHLGRAADGQLEFAAAAVRLEESAGDPLSAWQAASLLDAVAVYGDDGDYFFDAGRDPLLASGGAAGIDGAGVVRLSLPDGNAVAAIPALNHSTFFVVLDLARPFGPFAPATLRVTALTDGSAVCEAEDRTHDLPLDLEWAANVSTATLALADVLLRDGFELGTSGRWSATRP